MLETISRVTVFYGCNTVKPQLPGANMSHVVSYTLRYI